MVRKTEVTEVKDLALLISETQKINPYLIPGSENPTLADLQEQIRKISADLLYIPAVSKAWERILPSVNPLTLAVHSTASHFLPNYSATPSWPSIMSPAPSEFAVGRIGPDEAVNHELHAMENEVYSGEFARANRTELPVEFRANFKSWPKNKKTEPYEI